MKATLFFVLMVLFKLFMEVFVIALGIVIALNINPFLKAKMKKINMKLMLKRFNKK
jgi:hypothetical protein